MIGELAALAATYTSLRVQISLTPHASDHVPFITDPSPMPAVLTIEAASQSYSYMHHASDTLDKLDLDLMLEIAHLNLAWVCEKGR
jgi:hypothetical protein